MTFNRSYKYRMYPTKTQRVLVDNILNFCRFLYNCALEERISYYKRYGKSATYKYQEKFLKEIKQMFPQETFDIYAQTLQQVLKKLDVSYSRFFKKTSSFPRFKSQKSFKSILFPQGEMMGAGGAKLLPNGNFKFFKIGEVKTILHRPMEGRCKQVILKKDGDQYYVIVICELETPKVAPISNPIITGIDLGLNSFITQDDGTSFHHPKPYKTSKEKLAFQQRKLALKKKGSNSRRKAVKALQTTSRHVANIRDDWQHKTANHLLKSADVICMEKLDIDEMMASTKPSIVKKSNIGDAAWAAFSQKLAYKAESAGKQVVFVNPKNTSKTCSYCQKLNNLTLRDRIFDCHYCGAIMDRDQNAALNIKWIGTIQAGLLFSNPSRKFLPLIRKKPATLSGEGVS